MRGTSTIYSHWTVRRGLRYYSFDIEVSTARGRAPDLVNARMPSSLAFGKVVAHAPDQRLQLPRLGLAQLRRRLGVDLVDQRQQALLECRPLAGQEHALAAQVVRIGRAPDQAKLLEAPERGHRRGLS